MNLPSQEVVKEWLFYEPSTGLFVWRRKPRTNRIKCGQTAGTHNKSTGYNFIKIPCFQRIGAHRLAWLYVYGEWPTGEIDHINGSPSDNRITNLRIATKSQNAANTRARNSSGRKGVHYRPKRRNWVSRITVNGKEHFLGVFDDPESAHKAYMSAATALFGEFARGA